MISRQRWLRSALLVTVLLGVWTEVTRGEARIQLNPQYPAIGGSVTLTVTGITGSIQVIYWYKGPESSEVYRILSYLPGPPRQVPGPLFHNRMEVPSSGSLRISNLNKADEGQYRAKIQTDRERDISVSLTVYEAVGKPTITSNSSEPKENDSVTLTCASSNAERITWSRVRGSISSGVTYSLDNKTLIWPRISHTDSGSYQCKGENSISNSISDPYTLTISYSTDSIPQSPIPVAIIGSVIAVVVLLILLVALIYVFIKRRKGQKDNSSAKGGTSRNGQANASATPEEPPEIQYADIVIKRMPRKQEQQPPPESVYANRAAATKPPDDNVVYSELRI